MIRQYFRLPEYDWGVYVYYYVDRYYAEEILSLLEGIGIARYDYTEASDNLYSGKINKGLCYSNFKDRLSVLVISDTSSPQQFMNSFVHEARHLERHIEQALNISPYGERASYLAGTIAQYMFPKAKYFLCDCYKKGD